MGVALMIAACSSKPAAVSDAAADAWCAPSDLVYTPVTVTGTSPEGTLDTFHYATAGWLTGFCQDSYVVTFTTAMQDPSCDYAPWLSLSVFSPFTSPGTNRAYASLTQGHDPATENVTFEATQIDQPDAMPAHIIGHFVSNDPAWSFDIPVDLTSQFSTNCI